MNKMILRLVMAFKGLYRGLGVDTGQLEAILGVKLTMDDRRPRNVFGRNQPQKKRTIRNSTLGTIFMSLVLGCVYLYFFFLSQDYLTAFTLFFLMFMVMLSITLISDFTDVLIDVKDNYIILPRPVNAQTILMARLLHILIHLCRIVVPMMLPGLVYVAVQVGAGGALLFCLNIVLATLVCIFAINAIYLLILRVTTVERFKDIIGGVQIVFSILVFAIYYLGPRLASSLVLAKSSILGHRYFYPLPPLWLAALWEVLRHPAGQTPLLYTLAAAGAVLPPVCIWVVIRFLAPSFDRKLGGLGGGSAATPKAARRQGERGFSYRLATNWVTRGNTENTGFNIAWLLSGRSRDFKLKVYPSFAYVLMYFFYYVFVGKDKMSIAEKWNHLGETQMYILLIYFSSFAMISAISNLVYSDKYKASWIYYVSPIEAPGQILVGAVKAMLVKYFIPFYALVSILAFYVWGLQVLPDLILGLVNVTWFGLLMGFLRLKKFPFSAAPNIQAGSGRFIQGLLIIAVPGLVGVGHYLIRHALPSISIWLIWLFTVLSVILVWMIYGRYREVSWAELEKASAEF